MGVLKLAVVASITVSIAAYVVEFFIRRKYDKLRAARTIITVDRILAPSFLTNEKCRDHVYERNACSACCSYNYLCIIVRSLENAKHSISLCMGATTLIEIHEALVRAHKRGVVVRYISDVEMLHTTAARAHFLQESGIAIKMAFPAAMNIQTNFCLIDEHYPGKANMFFGTLNLTIQGLTTNWEMIFFTKDPKVISEYRGEFEVLWDMLQDDSLNLTTTAG